MSTDIFPFEVWQSGTNENSIPANDNALRSEVLAKGALDFAGTAPASPASGDLYVVSGAWGSFAVNDVVIFVGGVWLGFAPFSGWAKTVGGVLYFYDDTVGGWVNIEGGASEDTFDTETVSSGAIDLSVYNSVWVVDLTENITAISLPVASTGKVLSMLILFKQDATGGRTVTGWGSVFFESGAEPVINATADSITSVPVLILGSGDIYVVG